MKCKMYYKNPRYTVLEKMNKVMTLQLIQTLPQASSSNADEGVSSPVADLHARVLMVTYICLYCFLQTKDIIQLL